jgi:hypothetical protein
MIVESTPENREQQLTARLELEFLDELGGTRKLPVHTPNSNPALLRSSRMISQYLTPVKPHRSVLNVAVALTAFLLAPFPCGRS